MIARAAAVAGIASLLLGAAASQVQAQTVRGIVVDGTGNPVAGVVVLLVDTSDAVASRALSNGRGEFRVAAQAVGSYRVRTMRIGYRAVLSESLTLHAGETLDRRITLSGVRVALDTVRVVDRSACRTTGDSGLATFAILEQVRTALTATLLTSSTRTLQATTVRYVRTLDPGMHRVRDQSARVSSDYVRQPWSELSADSVRRFGYAFQNPGDSATFYAPGLSILSSNEFITDHCFHLQAADDSRAIGVAFTPARNRRDLPEIAGTLWVDRATAELRSLEYHYVQLSNVPRDALEHAGGDIQFARMHGGGWVISSWDIRMPVLATEVNDGHRDTRLRAMRVSGGALSLARQGGDTVWSRPPLMLRGVVVDSTTGRGVSGARVTLRATGATAVADSAGRFAIPDILYGDYAAEVRTPSLDSIAAIVVSDIQFTDSNSTVQLDVWPASLAAPALCGDAALFKRQPALGIVAGQVRDVSGGDSPRAMSVAVQWKELSVAEHGDVTQTPARLRALGATTDARGEFRVCGAPVDTRLDVAAMVDGRAAPGDSARIPPGGRFAWVDLTVDAKSVGTATFHGRVFADSEKLPIRGVEVAFPALSRLAFTDSSGAFALAEIPAGAQHLLVRRVGYGPLDTTLTFAANRAVEHDIHLMKVTVLDSVKVLAQQLTIPGFEDHLKVGLGQFLTRDSLEAHKGTRLSTLLQNKRGVLVRPGVGNIAWLASGRGQKSIDGRTGSMHTPDTVEKSQGAKPDCYTHVYVDGHLVFGRSQADPLFDLNRYSPDQIEAVEYYAGPSETPAEYDSLNAACGVLVIWTRRTP